MTKNIDKLIAKALQIEAQSAQEAGAIGFMARSLVQATMPHKPTKDLVFVRENGEFRLMIMAGVGGMPYGSIPRLLVAFLTSEAVKTGQRKIFLGDSLSDFMRQLGMSITGGRGGSIGRVKGQMERLFSSSIRCSYSSPERFSFSDYSVSEEADIWWNPKNPEQLALFESYVLLKEKFFLEVTQNPVPIDMRALQALKQSPMALDIYTWLTYRMSYLKQATLIPWPALAVQFGADYERGRDFKAAFSKHMNAVLAVYPEANVCAMPDGLELRPSKPHVPKLPK